VGWTLICAPAATPKPIIDTLNAAFAAAAQTPEVHALMLQLGTLPVKSAPPAELKPWLAVEVDRWGKLVERAGVAKTL
jgi:tripartite-type tricarboxylate transporter receptor subunit TctC